MAELNRVLNHLMFLGSYAFEVEPHEPRVHGFAAREAGPGGHGGGDRGRMHFMFNRVGGLKEDVPAGWLTGVGEAVVDVRRRDPSHRRLLRRRPLVLARTKGVGVLPPPRSRAVRSVGRARPRERGRLRPAPRRAVPGLRRAGRTPACCACRPAGEASAMRGSPCCSSRCASALDVAEACIDRLRASGRVRSGSGCRRSSKAPEGSTYCWTENPLGINGYFLESRGEKTPWRLKLRTASFNTVSRCAEVLPAEPGRGSDGDPRVAVLRRRRHRQVAHIRVRVGHHSPG